MQILRFCQNQRRRKTKLVPSCVEPQTWVCFTRLRFRNRDFNKAKGHTRLAKLILLTGQSGKILDGLAVLFFLWAT